MVTVAYELSTKKQVFIDWALIEPGYGVQMKSPEPRAWEMPVGVRIVPHKPRIDWTPLVTAENPWEANVASHTILFKDGGKYRLYYRCRAAANYETTAGSLLAYAESDDGVKWTKPTIGTVTFDGSKDNNLVYGMDVAKDRAVISPSVFIDPSAGPDERYKLVYRDVQGATDHIYGAVSPDGLHWTTLDEPLLSGYHSDTQNTVDYDEDKGKYVGYWRGWTLYERVAREDGQTFTDAEGRVLSWPVLHGRRTIAYAETDRFDRWPEPRPIVETRPTDEPDVDIYTNAYTPWPGAEARLMFPAFFLRNPDTVEPHLMTSRDGLHWERHMDGPIIPAGPPGSDNEGGAYLGVGVVGMRPGEWSVPLSPEATTHNQGEGGVHRHNGYVCLATWRRDGFVSLEAEDEGHFSTVPMRFSGGKLEVNAWTRFGGEIRFELADASNETLGRTGGRSAETVAGRSLADCDPITGDHPDHVVTWNGESDVSMLAGKPVRLRVHMRRARLYSLGIS